MLVNVGRWSSTEREKAHMTDPNAGFPTGNTPYEAPQPAQPASDANAAYQQPQYTAPVPPAQPVPPAGAPYQAPATPDYAANIQNSVAGFAQNLGGKNVTVGGQSFDFISIITYVAGVLAIIACIVPFVSISAFGYSGSVSLFQGGDGWIVLVAVLAIAALTFFKKHLPAMIISALVLVLSIFEMVYSKSKINGINGSLDELGSNYGSLGSLASGYAKNAVAFGIGAYLLVIAALGLIVGTVLAFVNQKKAAKVAVPGVSAQPQYVPTAFPGAPVPAPAAPVSDAGVPQAPAAPQAPTAPVASTAYEQPAPAAPVYQQPDSDASYPGQTPQA